MLFEKYFYAQLKILVTFEKKLLSFGKKTLLWLVEKYSSS
jgi:hypothetical protein